MNIIVSLCCRVCSMVLTWMFHLLSLYCDMHFLLIELILASITTQHTSRWKRAYYSELDNYRISVAITVRLWEIGIAVGRGRNLDPASRISVSVASVSVIAWRIESRSKLVGLIVSRNWVMCRAKFSHELRIIWIMCQGNFHCIPSKNKNQFL